MSKHYHVNKIASLAALLLAGSGIASAATTVNLTAQPATASLPDGTTVPMWAYCGAAVSGGAGQTVGGTCQSGAWAPGPTIIVPVGDLLTINLTNNLPVTTSLTIVGQYGGSDLGAPNKVPSVVHAPQSGTWPVPGNGTFTPPAQPPRARSFGPEALAAGTHTYTWSAGLLRPGTYLYETGTHPSLQAPMGLYGVLIVTQAPVATVTAATHPVTTVTTPGQAYPSAAASAAPPGVNPYGVAYAGAPYDADATYLISEIDPVQNAAVNAAAIAGVAEDKVSTDSDCVQTQTLKGTVPCYPPAVNYRPTYFLINGSPFDATNPAKSTSVVADGANTGNLLLRFVNAGLRTHVPTIAGLQMAILSEDGNLAPGLPKVQSEVLLTPGRTADVLVQPASNGTQASSGSAAAPTAYTDAAYSIFDRSLALAGGNLANAGLHGYLLVAAAGTNANSGLTNAALAGAPGGIAAVTPSAANYTFSVAPNMLASFSASVATNSIAIGTPVTGATAPGNGSVAWNADGTFTYTPKTAPITQGDSFTYCSSASATTCGTVTLNVVATAAQINAPSSAPSYTSAVSTLYRALTRSAGVLAGYSASDGYPLTAKVGTVSGCSVSLNADGSFNAVPSARTGGTCTFGFTVTDPRNTASAVSATATVNFPAPSNLTIQVADALNGSTGKVPPISDYMWIIEEDQTFHSATPGTALPWSASAAPPATLATSFHRSHMPVTAVGCTGPISCGAAQSVQGAAVTVNYSYPQDAVLDPAKYYFISVLPGDAANPFINGYALDPTVAANSSCLYSAASSTAAMATDCGHSLGGASLKPGQTSATITVEPNPLKPAALSIYIFDDNSPTNNDYDANEIGLGGFEVIVNDVAGRSGDPVGQITYDAYNMPLTNSLLGVQGCPNETPAGKKALQQTNLVGMVYTCPDGDRQIAAVKVTATTITVTTVVPHQFRSSVQGPNPAIDISGLDIIALNGSFTVNTGRGENSATTFSFPNPGVPAGTQVKVYRSSIARDATTYQLAGQALINNIMPGRFDVLAHPGAAREGAGEKWYQVSTLEGTPGQDAFTKSAEPNYFQEFGPPGFHTFIGFVNPGELADQNKIAVAQSNPATGYTTISGKVTSLHMSRTIMETLWDSKSNAAIGQSNCFVAVNQTGETGNDVGFVACNPDGTFTLPPIPAGQQYELVIWDQWLDQIIAFKNISATQASCSPGTPACSLALGDIPVFSWFTRIETSVYMDTNNNGVRDAGEPGVPLVPVTIHFRDGSISNILTTDADGVAVFNELFPLFNWYVIESDQTRFTGTGVNVVVDAGGLPDCTSAGTGTQPCPTATATASSFVDPALPLTQQPANVPLGARTANVSNSSYVWTDPTTGQSYGAVPTGAPTSTSRVDAGTGQFNGMYQGVQTFINQTEMIDWGRRNYKNGENGGISGMVVYASTRGFDDPSLEVQFMWEPGVPRVQINLYREQANADGTTGYVFVNTTTSTSWDDWAAVDANNNTVNMKCPGQDSKDPYLPYSLGAGNQFKCYDGFHLWNQVQPAVFDGAYLFTTDSNGAALPPGTYVVEMVPPPGYEIVKEEDKNILIGDQWVAPPAQQFGGLSSIFIMPDQASLADAYNANNPGNLNTTQAFGFVGAKLLFPKCVGQLHQVPDYMSLFPASGQVSPFAGAVKPLCDRKEVVLNDQMLGVANFFVFTNTPRASHFTGLILDDAAAEINNSAPDFGEKFAASYAPVSLKDFNGVEIERVYSDQWGTYNGLAPSTWQVNVPNPSGYSPNMLVNCMNDPGPILDTNPSSPTVGQMIVDPLYNPSYSNFCYTNPFMPGMTVYLDTPILPVSAFAAGYNPPDCALPAATPAIKRVDSSDGVGPWIFGNGNRTLTINAQGDVQVQNPNYQGPSATTAPYNTRTLTRHYGFGQTAGSISINGTALVNVTWSDQSITATVPAGVSSGELSIVTSGGMKSVDTVTVNVLPAGSAKPFVVEPAPSVAGAVSSSAHPVQDAIDAATPGDLIILDAGNYPELVVMWKPVRLQGVGAASVVINAAKYPTQKLQNWRPVINQLFGVDTVAGNQVANSQVDPLPNQEITGGIVLLEPSVLATEEGAGITVLAKNPQAVDGRGHPIANCNNPATSSYPDQVLFPPTSNKVNVIATARKMSDSNFSCAVSRIDGISVTGGDSGGGIYVNGWATGLEISNNRVYGNAGSFNGGIRVGVPYLEGLTATPVAADKTIFGYDVGVNIHHNQITNNGTVEANPGTVSAANSTGAGGGLSICTGTDNYSVKYNFICGNYSSGDGGGIGHLGVSNNGVIAQNSILFNQSYQQTAEVNGGGIVVEGEQGTIGGLSLGTGSLSIDGNLIRGNFAQGGHGGGIRLQQVNGADVTANPSNRTGRNSQPWYHVAITNNMITNNVAGWGGGGISVADALSVDVSNNTISKNDSVGIVGTMIGSNPLNQAAPLGNTTGYPSPAGISVDRTSSSLLNSIQLPQAAYQYANVSLYNDIVWQNRSFFFALTPQAVGVGGAVIPTNTLCPSNAVADAYTIGGAGPKCAPLPAQTSIGTCVGTPSYWDLGTTDDASATPGSNGLGVKLNPTYSVITSSTGYAGTGNSATDPGFKNAYCNGARANPAFIFEPGQPFLDPAAQNLTAGATLDEAGNFVDVRFGPLYLYDPTTSSASSPGTVIGDYHLAAGAGGAYNDGGPIAGLTATLGFDIDGDTRPQPGRGVDIGADEFLGSGAGGPPAASLVGTTTYASQPTGSTSVAHVFTYKNTGTTPITVATVTLTNATNSSGFAIASNTCRAGGAGVTLPASGTCQVSVTFSPSSVGNNQGAKSASLTISATAGGGTAQTLALAGTAVAAPQPVFGGRGTYDFGGGLTTRTHAFTLTNNGAGGFVIGPIATAVTGTPPGPGGYTVSGGTCAMGSTLTAGASCTVIVQFNTSSATTTTGTLTVAGTAAGTSVPYAANQRMTGG